MVLSTHLALCAAGRVFGPRATSLSPQALPDQFEDLNSTAFVILKFIGKQPEQLPVVYSVHMPHAVGKTVFALLSKELDLSSHEDDMDYFQLLPDDIKDMGHRSDSTDSPCPVSSQAEAAGALEVNSSKHSTAASATAPLVDTEPGSAVASSVSAVSPPGQQPDLALASEQQQQRPLDYNAVLTKLANSGLYKVSAKQHCQEKWPTPSQVTWAQTQIMVAQLAAVLFWMMGPVQKMKLGPWRGKELWETVMQLLHKLLLGHMLDMSLDMMNVFHLLFEAVVDGWQFSNGSDQFDSTHVSQLGRAFLRRLVADPQLTETLFKHADDGTEDGKLCDTIINGVLTLCTFMGKSGFDDHNYHCAWLPSVCAQSCRRLTR